MLCNQAFDQFMSRDGASPRRVVTLAAARMLRPQTLDVAFPTIPMLRTVFASREG